MRSAVTGIRVVMLVNNPCVYDSRVVKSAETLAALGYSVTVVCRGDEGLADNELKNGVRYSRVYKKSFSMGYLFYGLRQAISGDPLAISLPARFAILTLWRFLHQAAISMSQVTTGLIEARRFNQPKKTNVSALDNKDATSSRRIKDLVVNAAESAYRSLESDEVYFVMKQTMSSIPPDIIHAHDLGTLSAGVALAKKHGSKLIYDSHELEMHRHIPFTKRQAKRRRAQEASGIAFADSVLTVSESIAAHLTSDYGIRLPTVIFNSPKKLPYPPPFLSTTLRQHVGSTASDPLGVYVGRVAGDRGLENILHAMVGWPELKFATVGPQNAAFTERFLGMAEGLGVGDRLCCLDPVPSEKLIDYISKADFSVLPIQNVCLSYYYCLPNKLFESVLAGLPVAVSNLKDMKELVEQWRCGLVFDETDPLAIANTLKNLYAQKDAYRLGEERLEEFAQLFSWEAQEEKLERVYKDLALA